MGNDGSTLLKSRAIVKFDMSEISASLSTYNKSVTDCKFVLQLYTSHAKNLPSDYSVFAKMLGQDWVNGTGYLSDLTTNGATWSGSMSASAWISGSQQQQIGTSRLYISGSGAGGGGGAGGAGNGNAGGYAGGSGRSSSYSGAAVTYAGGGGGGAYTGITTTNFGGSGGGGNGQLYGDLNVAGNGTNGLGGGGGGGYGQGTQRGGDGGSGIVIIRYLYQ